MGDPKIELLVPNFGFGFDDKDFSDRILHIEIVPDDPLPPIIKKRKSARLSSDDPNCSIGIEVKSLSVNSLILAEKSPFFYKLFKNGMMESQCKDVTLKINSSENTSLMDLLSFMYNNTLTRTKRCDLLDILLVADKFEVMSCMRYCIKLLLKKPMTLDSSCSYLELPSTVRVAQVVQPLIEASKQYLVTHYGDFSKLQEVRTNFPLSAIEVILGSDNLRVDSEDDVYEFVMNWARVHYPNSEERREIITKYLMQHIRFPYMSCSKLKEVLLCPDFDHQEVDKLVIDALFFKAETPNGLKSPKHNFMGRAYNHHVVKVIQLDFSYPRCMVYFDLKKEECANLFPSKCLRTQSFLLGGRWFYLLAQCEKNAQNSTEHFGLYVYLENGVEGCMLDITVQVIKNSSNEFAMFSDHDRYTLTDKEGWGWPDLFEVSWTDFISDESDYFIDGILHIRAELTTHD